LITEPQPSDQMVSWSAKTLAMSLIVLATKGRRGYDAQVGERGVKLSGGQRQRVALARVILKDAPILILDEATSALDVSVQAEILNLLKRLRAEQGLTYLLVTHNLPVVSFLCDRLAVMRQGRIVEIADVGQLKRDALTDPYSRELARLAAPAIVT
jgi:ABC-type dipeptide/oligopeptide/nickel transport system ATPase subunit